MKIIRTRYIPFRGFKCMQFLCFILVRRGIELSDKDVRHESIHWEQQKELLIVFFWLWYVLEWLLRLLCCWDFKEAYRKISFEQEAYFHDELLYYLEHREKYYWRNYLRL